jgi:hypothetical protein
MALELTAWSASALAYRPFDGTDAAVAAPGETEIELQPAGGLRDEDGTSLIAPHTVINYGFSQGWEAVFEGIGQTPLSPAGPTNLVGAGALLKHVIVPGSLQDKTGPSVATEFGELLPDSAGNSGVGASLAGIVSQRWDWGNGSLQRRDCGHARSSWRRLYWRHARGAVDMDGSAGGGDFLRECVWQGGDDIGSGRADRARPR